MSAREDKNTVCLTVNFTACSTTAESERERERGRVRLMRFKGNNNDRGEPRLTRSQSAYVE